MKQTTLTTLCLILALVAFALACRTADIVGNPEPTATRRATRAALRPTFTAIPTETETPIPTDTPLPTETPVPTDVPTDTPVPATPRPRPTNTPVPPTNPPPTDKPTATATIVFEYNLNGNSSCEGGSANESTIIGKITANDKGAVGQRVQASSGPGGEPVSENPAMSDDKGNYKVTLICGGKACNGDFYIWMVNANGQQASPFVKFNFSDSCRKGKQDFVKR
jgi:hypothetical protein